MKYAGIVFVRLLLCSFIVFAGCSRKVETESPPPTGLEVLRSAKLILESYVRGGERGNEQEKYKQIVVALRPTHPDKAEILEKGFADLRNIPDSAVKATAKKILARLGDID